MDTNYKVAVALIAGIAIGGVGLTDLMHRPSRRRLIP